MMDVNLHTEDMFVDTDIFVVTEVNNDSHDFVSIDNDLSDAVMIDISHDELLDAITVDFGMDSDAFVTIEDHVFVSDYTGDDNSDWIDLDLSHDVIV